MKLSDLSSGQDGVIVRIGGSGAFRRRITEMGFVRGKKIFVLRNAPMKDPIEYALMGYDVSLRRAEAAHIEVVTVDEAESMGLLSDISEPRNYVESPKEPESTTDIISVALVGNPNSGKTSLFNYLSGLNEHVGNYSGVTVDSKKASVQFKGHTITFTDLPGTYSLSAYSPEEAVVREHLERENFDIIINVIDGSNIERNLYLTTQLIDMELRIIVALNMYDELIASGDKFDYKAMGLLLGAPFVPTVAKKGRGVPHLLQQIIDYKSFREQVPYAVRVGYGQVIEPCIEKIESLVSLNHAPGSSSRFAAIRLLENDPEFTLRYNTKNVAQEVAELRKAIEAEYKTDITTVMSGYRYGFISGAAKETLKVNSIRHKQADVIDGVLTHKIWGFPIFLAIMWAIFYATFSLGQYPMDGIEYLVEALQSAISSVMEDGALKDLLVNGIIGGVGSVIVFLPNILLLFLFISMLEDSGYMARAAFIMDKLMHRIGLHGKSFIPLVMGFGCNVPAVMASRIIEDKSNRILTMLITPFMSCSARLPVYLLIVGAFFPEQAGSLLFVIYLLGILIAIITAPLFKKLFFKAKDQPFVMELPPYRIPSARSTLSHMWIKGAQYLQKMGGIILVAVVIIWTLSYYPTKQDSYLSRVGKTIEPVVAPLGFDWKIGVGLISGIAAKEIIVSTMGVINQVDENSPSPERQLSERLKADTYLDGPRKGEAVFTTPVALSFLAFVLIYFPCIAVVSAIGKESGSWRWALLTVVYTSALAWIVSFIIYNTLK